jgi:hypothetical protein
MKVGGLGSGEVPRLKSAGWEGPVGSAATSRESRPLWHRSTIRRRARSAGDPQADCYDQPSLPKERVGKG